MRKIYVSSMLVGMCLIGCLGDEGGPLHEEEASPTVGDDSAALAAQAPDQELTGSDRDAARHGFNDAMRSARLVNIDVDAMTNGLSVGSELKLALPGAGQTVLVIQAVRELLPGVTTLSGHLAGDENADFTLSIEYGKLVGSIRRGTNAWLVEPHTKSDQHLIRMIDRTILPRDEPAVGHPQQALSEVPRSTDQPRPTSVVTSTGNVRVLFLHANNVTNANAQAANIVTAFNNSLSLSAVAANNYLTLAGVQQVASSFNGQNRAAIITAMSNRAAPFATIDTAIANTAADIVFLLVQEDSTVTDVPNYGRVGGVAYGLNPANPFALSTDDYALGDLTALHEIGHVFGGKHEDAGAAAGIARPVVSVDDTWMTLMGGYVECPFNGLAATCVRLNRWSNPDQSYLGIPLGVAGQRDMESHLESSMPTVSGWRAEPPPPPTAPNPLVKQPGLCFGLFGMSWSAQPSTIAYELHRSTSSAFSSPVMSYSGSSTSTSIDVTSGTWYLRARACNAGGCSGWTNQVSATRLGVCH